MPVRKFRDVSEMGDTWYRPGSAELVTAIRRVWGFAQRTCPLTFPAGVYKHRTLADAEAKRLEWERANFEAHRARIAASRR